MQKKQANPRALRFVTRMRTSDDHRWDAREDRAHRRYGDEHRERYRDSEGAPTNKNSAMIGNGGETIATATKARGPVI